MNIKKNYFCWKSEKDEFSMESQTSGKKKEVSLFFTKPLFSDLQPSLTSSEAEYICVYRLGELQKQ